MPTFHTLYLILIKTKSVRSSCNLHFQMRSLGAVSDVLRSPFPSCTPSKVWPALSCPFWCQAYDCWVWYAAGPRSLLSHHVGSVPLVGTVAALLLLMFKVHSDLWLCLFCRACLGAMPEWRPIRASGQLARWLLKHEVSTTCGPLLLPLQLKASVQRGLCKGKEAPRRAVEELGSAPSDKGCGTGEQSSGERGFPSSTCSHSILAGAGREAPPEGGI